MKKPNHQAFRALLSAVAIVLLGPAFVGAQSFAQNTAIHALKIDPAPPINSPDTLLSKQESPYLVGIDDVLTVSVWHEPDLSRSVSVRPDGKISLPLVGEIQASGKSVLQLQDDVRKGLSAFVKDPEVVVIVSEIRSQRINVIGQVTRAGAFPLTQSMGVIDAIAVAGGLREYAKRNRIYILRTTSEGQHERIPYNYDKVLKGKPDAKEVLLEPHDTVVVP